MYDFISVKNFEIIHFTFPEFLIAYDEKKRIFIKIYTVLLIWQRP